MLVAVSLGPPSRCPACGARLTGASLHGHCPTCGVAVEGEIVEIRQSAGTGLVLLIMGLVLLVIAAPQRPFGQWEWSEVLVLGLLVLGVWMLVARRSRKAVLWPGGVILIGRTDRPERFSWQHIDAVHFSSREDVIQLASPGGGVCTSISADFFGSHRRARIFAREAAEWLERYRRPDEADFDL